MTYETPHEKYLDLARAMTGIVGKRVLEVGGSTPPNVVSRYSPTEWVCVNLDARSVAASNEQARNLRGSNYSAVCEDITTIEQTNCYDLVYSINAFEHIHDLDVAFGRMFRALRQGGYLFTLFGPIWSSDVGHHLSILTEDRRELHFFDGILTPWEHLTSNREAIHVKLAALYGEKTARRAVTYIYDYPDLNRLAEGDYLRIVRESGFLPVVILRNKMGRPPNLPEATSTREFLMILKKGPTSYLERGSCLARLAVAFAHQKVRALVVRRSGRQ